MYVQLFEHLLDTILKFFCQAWDTKNVVTFNQFFIVTVLIISLHWSKQILHVSTLYDIYKLVSKLTNMILK